MKLNQKRKRKKWANPLWPTALATFIASRTQLLTRVKEVDFCEGKVADLEETKRFTGLESADGVRPVGQRNML